MADASPTSDGTSDQPSEDDLGIGDGPLGDSGQIHDQGTAADGQPDGPAAIQISSLATSWATSRSIAWSWSLHGAEADFSRVSLVVGQTLADVESRSGSAIIHDGISNPKLGTFTNPDGGDLGDLRSAITSGHQPGTVYHGQAIAVDTLGRESVSNIVSTATISTTSETVIFSELATAGYSLPATFVHAKGGAYQGEYCYTYTNSCPDADTECFAQLRRQGFEVDVGPVSRSAFDTTAFLEVAVACDGRHSYFSQLRLTFGDPMSSSDLWIIESFTIRCDGAYGLLQVPLRAFGRDAPMPFEALANPMLAFTVGGTWGQSATVRVDEVRVRW